MSRKTFILDTNVLLYDMTSIHSFPGNDVVIPLIVLDELDRFKDKPGLLGESARYVNRFLDETRQQGSLAEGVYLENIDQKIKVEFNTVDLLPADLNHSAGDNKILGVALSLQKKGIKATVVTKDINFRVKCDVFKIPSEDYYKDHISNLDNGQDLYSGSETLHVTKHNIDQFFADDEILLEDLGLDQKLMPNQFVIMKSNSSAASALARVSHDKLIPVNPKINDMLKVNPRNKEQKFALDLLTNDQIKLVTITGIAGSGKTFLTLMSALSGIYNEKFDRIVITRSMQPVGKEIGFLPGTLDEKMSPWMSPIVDNFRCNFKDITYFEMMCQKRQIEVAPLTYMRGRTFNDSFIIVDEAQNATIHELKTIITRVGDNSKVILLGDIEQIDTPYIDKLSNGLSIVTEKFKESEITGHIKLEKGERSELATLASKVL
ncbi:PhoH family protein [bacterium]|nr:PhoH family protein [bacterium]